MTSRKSQTVYEKSRETYAEAEGPKRGFSERGWKENLPRGLRAHCPCDSCQQLLLIILATNTTKLRITIREITQLLSLLCLICLKKGNATFCCSFPKSSAAKSIEIRGCCCGGAATEDDGEGGGNGRGGLISMVIWRLSVVSEAIIKWVSERIQAEIGEIEKSGVISYYNII